MRKLWESVIHFSYIQTRLGIIVMKMLMESFKTHLVFLMHFIYGGLKRDLGKSELQQLCISWRGFLETFV